MVAYAVAHMARILVPTQDLRSKASRAVPLHHAEIKWSVVGLAPTNLPSEGVADYMGTTL